MASYSDITNVLNFSVSFKPTSAFPLDSRSMFGSYAAAAAAAATAENAGSSNTIYYIGQMLTVFENDVVATYQIQADKTLKAIGAQVIGDNKSVTIGESGEIGLKSFGVQYYKYIAADHIISGTYSYPDSMPKNPNAGDFVKIDTTWYTYANSAWSVSDTEPVVNAYYELTTGWKEGLQPKVVMNSENNGYELAWYEPSSTTVEGLSSAIETVQASVTNLQTVVNNNKTELENSISAENTRATEAEAALSNRITANETVIGVLNGDAGTEGSVKNQIAAAVSKIMENPDETLNSIQELVEWCNNHATEYLELQNDVTANTTAINALKTLVGDLPEGTSATTVIDYIVASVEAEKTRAMGVESGLDTRVSALETKTANLGTAANKDVEYFATAAQGAKADTAVQSVVKGEQNGHIAVDGNDVEVYTLGKATVTDLGGVKVDGTSIVTDDNGVASVSAVDSSKVTGLDTKLSETKTAAVNEAKNYTDENFVAKTDISDSTNVAESVEAASDAKVVSEKLFLDALTWKTIM